MIFNVVNTLPFSTLIFNSLIIIVKRYARRYGKRYDGILLLSLLHVTFTYCHSWYLVFKFTFSVN